MMQTKLIVLAIVVMAVRADDCSDSLPSRVCNKLSEDGKCQYGFAKDKCASTCDACKSKYQYNLYQYYLSKLKSFPRWKLWW